MNQKKPRPQCPVCQKEPARSFYKYCSNICQGIHKHNAFVEKWKRGEVTGLTTMGLVSKPVKGYLREKYKNKCCLCGWSEINQNTGLVPLVADHIDGNWRNNIESNLRLICPNCDALSATYGGANKGKGRNQRLQSKRALEARVVVFGEKA